MTYLLLFLLILLGLLITSGWVARPAIAYVRKYLAALIDDREQLILVIGLLLSGIGTGVLILYLVLDGF